VARQITGAGAGRGQFVGVTIDRSIESIIGLLGVVLAGTAYVPIPADSPRQRTRMTIEDADIRMATGADCPVAELFGTWIPAAPSGAVAAGGPEPDTHPDDAAYAIFTSGSTGRPKGVVVSHRAIVSSTYARFNVYPHENMTYLTLAPLTVDAAAAGLYFTLATGGRIIIPTDEEVVDPQLLAELIVSEKVSHLDGTPSQYSPIVNFYPESLQGLRCVILGGEELHTAVLHEHISSLPGVPLYNEYGPTEGTVWSTFYRCTSADNGGPVPIGQAVAGVRATVLGSRLQTLPPGEIGELYLSGSGLARGYLGRPAMTAGRFVADCDVRYPGERMYRTGDLASTTPGGDLVYHGRTDLLVKVRGFRIELGEIEARLLEHRHVQDAAVVPHESATGMRLSAVVVLAPGEVVGAREMAVFLAAGLPRYMVPDIWRHVDALPLTAAGKIDRLLLTSQAATIGQALPLK
jgi:amino acid adenylation domain-containing protein